MQFTIPQLHEYLFGECDTMKHVPYDLSKKTAEVSSTLRRGANVGGVQADHVIYMLIYYHSVINRDNDGNNELPYGGRYMFGKKGPCFETGKLPPILVKMIFKYIDMISI